MASVFAGLDKENRLALASTILREKNGIGVGDDDSVQLDRLALVPNGRAGRMLRASPEKTGGAEDPEGDWNSPAEELPLLRWYGEVAHVELVSSGRGRCVRHA
jgi:hypothetical protein